MNTMFASDSPANRPTPRFRFPRHAAKHLNMDDAKLAMDIIIRPSLHLLKLAIARSALTALKRAQKTVILNNTPSTSSSVSQEKRVRFNEKPVTISRRNFFERWRKSTSSSPLRPCLVVRLRDDVPRNPPKTPVKSDDLSIYEDCLSDHPGFLADIEVLESNQNSDTLPLKCIHRSEFYETEHGIASFDRTGYASYCLSRWLDKQREEAWAPKRPLFRHPTLLPCPDRTLSPPSSYALAAVCSVPPLRTQICRRPPRSLPLRIWKLLEDELHNAIVVLIIGSCIHICLFLYLLYDILTRGLIPAED